MEQKKNKQKKNESSERTECHTVKNDIKRTLRKRQASRHVECHSQFVGYPLPGKATAKANGLQEGKKSPNMSAGERHNPATRPERWDPVCTGWDRAQGRSHSKRLLGHDMGAWTGLEQLHAAGSYDSDLSKDFEGEGLAGVAGPRKDSGTSWEDQKKPGWGSQMGARLTSVRRKSQIGNRSLQAAGCPKVEMRGRSLGTGGHRRFHKLEKRVPWKGASGDAD